MATTLTLAEAIREFRTGLHNLYSGDEIRNFSILSAEHLLNYSKIDFITKGEQTISTGVYEKLMQIRERLRKGEPIQYIMGYTDFFGMRLQLDPRVLIPRPETEELVDLILKREKDTHPHVLDMGTGSGCIAIALALNLEKSRIFACDISAEALELAARNGTENGAAVDFFMLDMLDIHSRLPATFDVVVSNPPYVRMSERRFMHRNVLEYEPEEALFVTDDDPLLYYRHIAEKCLDALREGGRLYFEINEQLHEEVTGLLYAFGYKNIEMRHDLNGKPRMVHAVK